MLSGFNLGLNLIKPEAETISFLPFHIENTLDKDSQKVDIAEEEFVEKSKIFYASTESGNIGLTDSRKSDLPSDNVFSIDVSEDLNKNWDVSLEYELFGISHFSGISRAINDELAVGGQLVKFNSEWTSQNEKLSQRQLKPGVNIVRFTTPDSVNYGYKVKNVRINMIARKAQEGPVVFAEENQINNYEGTAYIRGYVNTKGAELFIDGQQVAINNGVFESYTTKGASENTLRTALLKVNNVEVNRRELIIAQAVKPDIRNTFTLINTSNSVFASPSVDWKLEMNGLSVSGAAGALSMEKVISVTALRSMDMPPMGPGMINVTAHASGYRLLPHNSKFDGALSLKIDIDSTKLPPGHSVGSVRTFFFDEETKKWTILPKDTVRVTGMWAAALTDHFTDFVNAIIKSPDLPSTQANTPTMFKDLKAANPLEGVNIIAPPKPNNNGTASLTLPIEIPAGRQGLQPQLALQYSSEGGNGWLGLGWALNIPSITVETRWGVPRYFPTEETESYLLNGEELQWKDDQDSIHPLFHRATLVNRNTTGSRLFVPRVEGSFNRIVRKGTSPSTYYWEVTDKNGITNTYGKYSYNSTVNLDSGVLSMGGKIASWLLTETRDLNGNFVRYYYKIANATGRFNDTNAGRQMQISKIVYTGHNETNGKYEVVFHSGTETRPDTIISGRYGFKEVTDKRLSAIEVKFDNNIIRTYKIKYKTGYFNKSMICFITEGFGVNLSGMTTFENNNAALCSDSSYQATIPPGYKIHRFVHYDNPKDDQVSILTYDTATFMNEALYTYTNANSDVKGLRNGLMGDDFINLPVAENEAYKGQILGTSQSGGIGVSASLYIGLGGKVGSKVNAVSGSYSYGWNRNKTFVSFMDVDGDGYPDRVFREGSAVFYEKLTFQNGKPYLNYLQSLPGLSTLGNQTSQSHGWGIQGVIKMGGLPANASLNYTKTTNTTPYYFADINGDGLIDFVDDNVVKFNNLDGNGVPYFEAPQSSTVYVGGSCGYIVYDGDVNDSIAIPIIVDAPEDLRMMNHQAVRTWKAPFTGYVTIDAPIQLVEDTSNTRRQARGLDGIKYSVQHNADTFFIRTIAPDDYTSKNIIEQNIYVAKGDHLYFRLMPRKSRNWDNVSWNPNIYYTSYGGNTPNTADENADGKTTFSYRASDDFLLQSAQIVTMPSNGTIRVYGNIQSPTLSDSVHFVIYGNGGNVTMKRSFSAASGINHSLDTSFTVAEDDTLDFRALISSRIAYEDLKFNLTIDYLSSTLNSNIDTSSEFERIRIKPLVQRDVLEYNPIPAVKNKITSTGTVQVTPRITFTGTPTGKIIFTVKAAGKLVAKKQIEITNGSISGDSTLTFSNSTPLDYYFDFNSDNHVLAQNVLTTKAKVVIGGTSIVDAGYYGKWPDSLAKFGNLYRGWGQFVYNSDTTKGILENLLTVNPHYSDTTNLIIIDENNFATDTTNLSSETPLSMTNKFSSSLDNMLDPAFHIMRVDIDSAVWRGIGNLTTIGNNWMSNSLPRSSFAVDNFESPIPVLVSPGAVTTIRKQSVQKSWTYGASIGPSIANAGGSRSNNEDRTLTEFMDLNGDRFPDIIGEVNVQYTLPTGGLSTNVVSHLKSDGVTTYSIGGSSSSTVGMNVGGSPQRFTREKGANGKVSAPVGGSYSGGGNVSAYTFIDVNGDGLPDKVNNLGLVALNLGYGFQDYVDWGYNGISESEFRSLGLNASSLTEVGENSWSLGAGFNTGSSETSRTPMDINGDGLTDYVLINSGAIAVQVNTGNGFKTQLVSTNFDPHVNSKNFSVNASISGTLGIPIPLMVLIVKVGATLSANVSFSKSREQAQFIDVNNDGFVDFVSYDENTGNTVVYYSTLAKVNQLKRVESSTGAVYNIGYGHIPSTQKMPQGKWVMSSLSVFDGFTGDGKDTTFTTFEYSNGLYDRYERVFLGYDSVVTKQKRSGGQVYRQTIERYHNHDFMFKGLKYYQAVRDSANRLFVENVTSYKKKEISTGDIVDEAFAYCFGPFYPAVYREDQYFYEGNSTHQIHTQKEFQHGTYGNVKKYINRGALNDLTDDFYANIRYNTVPSLNLLSLADSIQVFDSLGTLLRNRKASFNLTTGKLIKITAYSNTSAFGVTDFEYDGYGNITKQILPANQAGKRMNYKYTYDNTVFSYVVQVQDTFNQTSSTAYNYLLGKPTQTTDISGNHTYYTYNAQGRLKSIKGPKEAVASKPYTLKFDYWDESNHTFPWTVYSNPDDVAIWARTSHYDHFNSGNDITTVLFADGVGRVVQTKKKSTVAGTDVMVVSGKVILDDFGRNEYSYYPITEGLTTDSIYNAGQDGVNPSFVKLDVMDRPLLEKMPDNSATTTAYFFDNDHAGVKRFLKTVVDAKGHNVKIYTDHRQLQATIKAPHSATTRFKYNPLGELVESKDPELYTTSYQYDLLGRMISRSHPDAGITNYDYDQAGNLVAMANQNLIFNSQEITYEYDFNRLIKISYPQNPENDVWYEYGSLGNAKGRITKSQDASGVQAYEYGNMGELTKKTTTSVVPVVGGSNYTFSTSWQYDSWNRLEYVFYPDQELVTYDYNNGGNLYSMSGDKSSGNQDYINSIVYDKFGSRTSLEYGNGVISQYTYNNQTRRLSELTTTNGTDMFQDISYSYDIVGNILSISNTGSTVSGLGGGFSFNYAYDSLYRLASSYGNGADDNQQYTLAMEYTPSGNIYKKALTASKYLLGNYVSTEFENEYTYGGGPHQPTMISDLTSNLPTTECQWDGSGNMTMQQLNTDNGWIERGLCWDEENRLSATRDDNYLTHNIYDASGTRAWKLAAEANYMWANGNLYASGSLNLRTLYQSEYTTITDVGYTKHYYIEGQRVASKLGGGFMGMKETEMGGDETTITANLLEPIYKNIDDLGESFWTKMMRDFTCVGINGDILEIDPRLPAIDILLERDDSEGDIYFYHGDHLGSSSYITDINGDATQHMEYLPFGEDFVNEQNATSYYTPYTFSGKERDMETQYSYFGARYYEAGLSIWLSVDPMSDKAPDWTPYRYSFQNPVKYIDPNGLFEDEATATAARNKAVEKFGASRITEVYFNSEKNEWGFGVSVDEMPTVGTVENGVSTTSASRTNGVYTDEPKLDQMDADFTASVVTGGTTIFGNAAELSDMKVLGKNLGTLGTIVTAANYAHAIATDQVQPAHHVDAGMSGLIIALTLFPATTPLGVGLGIVYGGGRIIFGEAIDNKINSTFK